MPYNAYLRPNRRNGVRSTGRQTNWATYFGQLGDNSSPELNLVHFVLLFMCLLLLMTEQG